EDPQLASRVAHYRGNAILDCACWLSEVEIRPHELLNGLLAAWAPGPWAVSEAHPGGERRLATILFVRALPYKGRSLGNRRSVDRAPRRQTGDRSWQTRRCAIDCVVPWQLPGSSHRP